MSECIILNSGEWMSEQVSVYMYECEFVYKVKM